MFDNTSSIKIPAYDSFGEGLVISLKVTALTKNGFSLTSIGNIAIALENNFRHTIEVISSIKKSWEILYYYNYVIECENKNFVVKDAKSSSMAISIALLNLHRSMNDKQKIENISGTGVLRIDGSFDSSCNEESKNQAMKKVNDNLDIFITTKECNHLYDLEKLMNQY